MYKKNNLKIFLFCISILLYSCGINYSFSPTTSILPTITFTSENISTVIFTPISSPTITPTITDNNSKTPNISPTNSVTYTLIYSRGPSDRYIETAGLFIFSYVPPKEWIELPCRGSTSLCRGQTSWWVYGKYIQDVYDCILFFTTENYPNTNAQAIAEMRFHNSNYLLKSKFVTDTVVDAYKMKFILQAPAGDGIFSYYIFYQDPYLVIAEYSRPRYARIEQDSNVDLSMKTFQFE